MGLPQVIIAILLGVVLLAMNSDFLGDVFAGGAAEASAGELLKQSEEIKEGINTYRALNSGALPVTYNGSGDPVINMQTLVDEGLLDAVPPSWEATGLLVSSDPDMVTEGACLAVNKKAGYDSDTVPSCGALPPALTDVSYYCCDAP